MSFSTLSGRESICSPLVTCIQEPRRLARRADEYKVVHLTMIVADDIPFREGAPSGRNSIFPPEVPDFGEETRDSSIAP
jgi:hypothetical protein